MDAEARDHPPGSRAGVAVLLGLALAAAGGAAALVIADRDRAAAGAAAVSGGIAVLAGRRIRRVPTPRLVFADASVERLLEGMVFGAIAWDAMPGEPRVGAAALVALGAGYVAGYLKARAKALGFRLEESVVDRSLRAAAVAAGLGTGLVEAGLWAAAAWSLATTLVRALEVSRQREAA